jgi:hypothetical protein
MGVLSKKLIPPANKTVIAHVVQFPESKLYPGTEVFLILLTIVIRSVVEIATSKPMLNGQFWSLFISPGLLVLNGVTRPSGYSNFGIVVFLNNRTTVGRKCLLTRTLRSTGLLIIFNSV